VGRRAFIVAAGPAANFLLAILLYWLLFMSGVTELKPRLGLAAFRNSGRDCRDRRGSDGTIRQWQGD
jgi:membrane-associated protease RseP (regulator of RpoE activity)